MGTLSYTEEEALSHLTLFSGKGTIRPSSQLLLFNPVTSNDRQRLKIKYSKSPYTFKKNHFT